MMNETLPSDKWASLEGYAAVFGQPDLSGDVIVPGAFSRGPATKLMPDQKSRIMMLYQHTAERPIGRWDRLIEDDYGLRAQGRILLCSDETIALYHLLVNGVLDGLSIGFKIDAYTNRRGGGRYLSAVSLWEISIVSFPMAPAARIDRIETGIIPQSLT